MQSKEEAKQNNATHSKKNMTFVSKAWHTANQCKTKRCFGKHKNTETTSRATYSNAKHDKAQQSRARQSSAKARKAMGRKAM